MDSAPRSEPDARCTPAEAEEAGGGTGRAAQDTRPGPRGQPASAGGPTGEEVAAIAASLLDCASVDPDADLFALGATSFMMIRLARAIEQRHGARVPVDLLVTRPSARRGRGPRRTRGADRPPPVRVGAPDVEIALDPEAKAAFKAERRPLRRFEAPHRVARLPSRSGGPRQPARRRGSVNSPTDHCRCAGCPCWPPRSPNSGRSTARAVRIRRPAVSTRCRSMCT